VEILDILGAAFPPPTPVAIAVKFCTVKRTHVPVGPSKVEVNRCYESPLCGENLIFGLSKFNTGSLPLCGILPVTNGLGVSAFDSPPLFVFHSALFVTE